MSDTVRLCEPPPAFCSSCFNQDPDARHVDFNAHYEGPVLPSGEESVGVVAVAIDELILCEACVTRAAELLGLGDTDREREEVQRLTYATDDLRHQLKLAVQANRKLEEALEARDSLEQMLEKQEAS